MGTLTEYTLDNHHHLYQSHFCFSNIANEAIITNRINLPSIDEELACFEVWVCRSGDFAILQISSERTDERCFLPGDQSFSNPHRNFNHLPVPLVEAFVEMSTSIQRFSCQHKIRPKMTAVFQTEGGWEVCALAAAVHQAPDSRCMHASEGLASRSVVFGPSHRLRVESGAFSAFFFVEY